MDSFDDQRPHSGVSSHSRSAQELRRVRPITCRLLLIDDLRLRRSAHRFTGRHPEDARRADAGPAEPSQASYQRRRLIRRPWRTWHSVHSPDDRRRGNRARGPVGVLPAAPAGRGDGAADDRAVRPERPVLQPLVHRPRAADLRSTDSPDILSLPGWPTSPSPPDPRPSAWHTPVLLLAAHWRSTGGRSDRRPRDPRPTGGGGADPHRRRCRRPARDLRGPPRSARRSTRTVVLGRRDEITLQLLLRHRRAGVGAVWARPGRCRPGRPHG